MRRMRTRSNGALDRTRGAAGSPAPGGCGTARRAYRHDPRYVRQWLRQNNLIYGGLIGIGVVIVQPFLTGAELDGPATVSVVAFSLAIPLLAALIMLNEEETFLGVVRPTRDSSRSPRRPHNCWPSSGSWRPSGTSSGSPAWASWRHRLSGSRSIRSATPTSDAIEPERSAAGPIGFAESRPARRPRE